MYKLKRKVKVVANEGVYYRENRTILKEKGKYILRNTFTGEEEPITKKEVMELKKEWKELDKYSDKS